MKVSVGLLTCVSAASEPFETPHRLRRGYATTAPATATPHTDDGGGESSSSSSKLAAGSSLIEATSSFDSESKSDVKKPNSLFPEKKEDKIKHNLEARAHDVPATGSRFQIANNSTNATNASGASNSSGVTSAAKAHFSFENLVAAAQKKKQQQQLLHPAPPRQLTAAEIEQKQLHDSVNYTALFHNKTAYEEAAWTLFGREQQKDRDHINSILARHHLSIKHHDSPHNPPSRSHPKEETSASSNQNLDPPAAGAPPPAPAPVDIHPLRSSDHPNSVAAPSSSGQPSLDEQHQQQLATSVSDPLPQQQPQPQPEYQQPQLTRVDTPQQQSATSIVRPQVQATPQYVAANSGPVVITTTSPLPTPSDVVDADAGVVFKDQEAQYQRAEEPPDDVDFADYDDDTNNVDAAQKNDNNASKIDDRSDQSDGDDARQSYREEDNQVEGDSNDSCPDNCLHGSCNDEGNCRDGCKDGFFGLQCAAHCPRNCAKCSRSGQCDYCHHGFVGRLCTCPMPPNVTQIMDQCYDHLTNTNQLEPDCNFGSNADKSYCPWCQKLVPEFKGDVDFNQTYSCANPDDQFRRCVLLTICGVHAPYRCEEQHCKTDWTCKIGNGVHADFKSMSSLHDVGALSEFEQTAVDLCLACNGCSSLQVNNDGTWYQGRHAL